jgi:hypothetical protein
MTSPSATRYDYVTVGHVTCDEIEHDAGGPSSQPGGSAFYSALQAARLGRRTLILTQGVPGEIEALLEPYLGELELYVVPAERTTRLRTRGTGAARTQRMIAWAGPIAEPFELDTAILHLAPVARETPVSWGGSADFVGITPQGLIRRWEPRESETPAQPDNGSPRDTPTVQVDMGLPSGEAPSDGSRPGEISQVPLDPTLLPRSFDAAVISEQEREGCRALFSAAGRCDAPVAVTAGSGPTTVYSPTVTGEPILQTVRPPLVAVREDLGAGDVFAAAFFIAIAGGQSSMQAATFGNAAAAIRIAGEGPAAIGRPAGIIP